MFAWTSFSSMFFSDEPSRRSFTGSKRPELHFLSLNDRWKRVILFRYHSFLISVPVAQLDRASASEVEGRGFESRRVHHFFTLKINFPQILILYQFVFKHRWRSQYGKATNKGDLKPRRARSTRKIKLGNQKFTS